MIKFVLAIFKEREVPTAEGLLLFNATLIHASEVRDIPDINELVDGLVYALEGSCGNKVQYDALIVLSSMALVTKSKKPGFTREMIDRVI